MNKKEFQIVSAPFASGVSWLVSIFLELNIKMTNMGPLYKDDHWADTNGESVMSEKSLNYFKGYFPILSRKGNRFCFDSSFEGFWEHRLDFALYPDRPTILYVRDPRDAIFSLYRRDYSKTVSFEEYLLTPSCWPDHYPDMFGLPPFETWAYYNLFWYNLKNSIALKIVTFEAMKMHPEEEIIDMLKFLGIEKSKEQIREAINNSSLDSLKKSTSRHSIEQNERKKIFYKGKVGEWKEHYTPFQETFCDNELVSYAMSVFGYAARQSKGGANILFSGQLDTCVSIDDCVSLALEKGDNSKCLSELNKRLIEERADFIKYAHLLAAKISIMWIQLITSGNVYRREITEPIFKSLYLINRYLYIKHIFPNFNEQYKPTLLTPLLVDEEDGYNLVKIGPRYWAVSQSLGPVDLEGAAADRLLEKYGGQGKCFSGDSLFEVKYLIAKFKSANMDVLRGAAAEEAVISSPLLIDEEDGYNLIKVGSRYWAVSQSLGSIDLEKVGGDDLLEKYGEQGKCFSGGSLFEVKYLIAKFKI